MIRGMIPRKPVPKKQGTRPAPNPGTEPVNPDENTYDGAGLRPCVVDASTPAIAQTRGW